MVIFDAVVQDFHVRLTEHLVVEFLGDDVWEHLLAMPIDTSSLTTRESGFSGCVPVSCPPWLAAWPAWEQNNQMSVKRIHERTMVNKVLLAPSQAWGRLINQFYPLTFWRLEASWYVFLKFNFLFSGKNWMCRCTEVVQAYQCLSLWNAGLL